MVAINRGPGVVGWDPASSKPKGVVSPSEHRGGLTALAQREGVFYTDGTDAAIGTSTSSRQLTVAPAGVAISAPLGGWYLPWWGSTLQLTPAVAGAQPRIDTIAVVQHDYELDGTSVSSEAEVVIVQGSSSATPSPAVLTDGQLPLWYVRVPAGAMSSDKFVISRAFRWTAPVGSEIVAATLSDLQQVSGSVGQRARVVSDATAKSNGTYTHTGSAWRIDDTGWVDLVPTDFYKLTTGQGLRGVAVRRIGKTVYLEGSFNVPGTVNIGWTWLNAIPSGFRPMSGKAASLSRPTGTGIILANSSGTIVFAADSFPPGDYILTGTWLLD